MRRLWPQGLLRKKGTVGSAERNAAPPHRLWRYTSWYAFLWHCVSKQRWRFLAFAACWVFWAISETIFPYFLNRIIDVLQLHTANRAHAVPELLRPVFSLVVFWVLGEVVMHIQGVIQIYAFPKLRAHIRRMVFEHLKKQPQSYFLNQFAGNLAHQISELPESTQTLVENICCHVLTTVTGIVIIVSLLWSIWPTLSAILLVWLSVHALLSACFLYKAHQAATAHAVSVSALSGRWMDVIANMFSVKLFARTDYEAERLKKSQRKEIEQSHKAMWIMEWMRVSLGVNSLLLMGFLLYTLIQGWTVGRVEMGDITQTMMQASWIVSWVWFLSFQCNVMIRSAGKMSDALGLLKQAQGVLDRPNAPPIRIVQGEIRFKNVDFGYKASGSAKRLFSQLSVVIPAGQKVGLVGFSGSGKTTFVNLILRFFDPQSGEICIDDHNIAHCSQDSLRESIGFIPQDPVLFHRSLAENIRYSRLQASDEEVIAAARLAYCHDFIVKLEHGYATRAGERGLKLSGGQRQRIAIARAILKNAPILILDEATSALDSQTEACIQESLKQMMQKKTCLVIAHRLSTVSEMDRILVFDKGRIVQDGPPDDLLQTPGPFLRMWDLQHKGFLATGA